MQHLADSLFTAFAIFLSLIVSLLRKKEVMFCKIGLGSFVLK
mgnify:CR=1 FL=1